LRPELPFSFPTMETELKSLLLLLLPAIVWLLRQFASSPLDLVFHTVQELPLVTILLLVSVWATVVFIARRVQCCEQSSCAGTIQDHPKVEETPKQEDYAEVKVLDMATGRMTSSNPSAPMCFDSEVASGVYLFLHRRWELGSDAADAEHGADAHQSKSYFHGKRRLWEVRFQCCFKQRVSASSLRIGCSPYVRRKLGPTQVAAHRLMIMVMGPTLRGMYNSPGDDPKGRAESDVEKPVTSITIAEADQYIAPSHGEPPDLLDEAFPSLGTLKVRDPVKHKRHLREIVFEAGETHTFGFWAPSRAFDLARWRVDASIPFVGGLSLDALNGPPPLLLSVYVLKPGCGREKRHLQSRKVVVWEVAGWSNQYPPAPEHIRSLKETAEGVATMEDSHGKEALQSGSNKPVSCHACLMPCGVGIHKFIRSCLS